MVFWVSVQLAVGRWSDEALCHLRLLMHHHRDRNSGAPSPFWVQSLEVPEGGAHGTGGMGADSREVGRVRSQRVLTAEPRNPACVVRATVSQ